MSKFVILAGGALTLLAVGTVSLAASPPASTGGVAASAARPSPALTQRAEQLVRLINGETAPDKVFAPAFLAQVPAERLTRLAATVRAKYGSAIDVARIEAVTATSGTIYLNLENSQVPIKLLLADQAPHLVMGMQF